MDLFPWYIFITVALNEKFPIMGIHLPSPCTASSVQGLGLLGQCILVMYPRLTASSHSDHKTRDAQGPTEKWGLGTRQDIHAACTCTLHPK